MVRYGHKIEEEVKSIQTEIKKNIQGTNSDRKETMAQINNLEQKEEMNIQPEQMKKQEFRKMRTGLGTSGPTLNFSTSKS